jgi:hypothetical protein
MMNAFKRWLAKPSAYERAKALRAEYDAAVMDQLNAQALQMKPFIEAGKRAADALAKEASK